MTVRQDYIYPNLPKSLVGVVDLCVSSIYKNGTQVYASRKDFIVKAINVLIEYETARHTDLEKEIKKLEKKQISKVIEVKNSNNRGSRFHVNKTK